MIKRTSKQVQQDINSGTKVCIKCLQRLPFSHYSKGYQLADGHISTCRDCASISTGLLNRRSWSQIQSDKATQSKVCTCCKIRKPWTEYYGNNKNSDGLVSKCKECTKKGSKLKRIQSVYGLSAEDYHRLISKGCEVCGSMKKLCVDHDHATGKVRGCLCRACNASLGLLREDRGSISNLLVYFDTKC